MSDEKYTRCPGCATVFRVTPDQLALRSGQVRCGQCKTVFDGLAQQVSVAKPSRSNGVAELTEKTATPSFTLQRREPEALEGLPEMPTEPALASIGDIGAEPASEDRFSPARRRAPRRVQTAVAWIATVVLLIFMAGQALFHFRDVIAARLAPARPVLATLCNVAGCSVRPLRDPAMSNLSIEASDLQADPAHRGLLILTATLRSRAVWALAYPYLELTLTDTQDRVVVRRALAPGDYAGGTADLQRGIAPNGEVAVKLFIDASATSQAGYQLYMFYP